MMNIGPTEAKGLTLHDYQALCHSWAAAHSSEDDDPEPPSIEETEGRMRELESRGVKVLN